MRLLTMNTMGRSARLEEDGGNGHWRRSPDDELQKNSDSRRCSGSQQARVGEEVEDDGAQLRVATIGKWWRVAPASRRRSLSTRG